MKQCFRRILSLLPGLLYAAAAVCLSRLLIRTLSVLFSQFGGMAGLDAETLAYGAQVLAQFKSAVLVSPWLPALLTGAAFGALTSWLTRRRPLRIVAAAILWLILLLPMALAALWYTEVNGIMTCALVRTLLPLLPALL